MSMETDVILRSILYQIETAKTLEELRKGIRAICPEDMVASIQKKAAEEAK
ncbi:hypothetical protein AGMMS49975_04110 [Clostridia bacterium]|nr:hypothetical protein AGMMS49975_04110 [Clostridia bacterium]